MQLCSTNIQNTTHAYATTINKNKNHKYQCNDHQTVSKILQISIQRPSKSIKILQISMQ